MRRHCHVPKVNGLSTILSDVLKWQKCDVEATLLCLLGLWWKLGIQIIDRFLALFLHSISINKNARNFVCMQITRIPIKKKVQERVYLLFSNSSFIFADNQPSSKRMVRKEQRRRWSGWWSASCGKIFGWSCFFCACVVPGIRWELPGPNQVSFLVF